jgi:antitoxin component of RelBE/YafQ-DinJ toxin-antitoxin module
MHKRDDMIKTARLNIRLSEVLKSKVEQVAKERGVTVSELITDYIKRLPNPTK